ncbi:unnamed protein product [Ambrosiozyma monospora]|uniref:Unnamed protein product n=1 Tax=Ambrosiozyma monospora TaxID=43982 RepID=A0ACB5TR81_AMBMO|nr:unnamed protein product [Ambrosiozyma monospora]
MDITQVYRFGKTLGSGSFGSVVYGVNRFTREKVAIKIISKVMCHRKGLKIHDILREIKLLSKVHHENVIGLVDWYEDDGCFYIITKLAKGGELFDRIMEESFFSEQDAVKVITKLLHAVIYLHDHGIVHRDIKPENILYMNPCDNDSIVLCDFGLATYISPNSPKLFGTPGTPTYRAPEIFLKDGHDNKVDIWGVGIIAYILITGRVPVSQDSNVKRFLELVNHPSFPTFVEPDETSPLSASSKDFVRICLNTNPERRPTARELLNHPWISGHTAYNTYNLIPNIRANFNAKKALQLAIRKVIMENNLKKLKALNEEVASATIVNSNILSVPVPRNSNESLFSYKSSNSSFESLMSGCGRSRSSSDVSMLSIEDLGERQRRKSSLSVHILQDLVKTVSENSDELGI